MKNTNRHAGELSWGAHVIGALTLCANLALAARLVWEETVLTWAHGPQMVGFSLMHSGGLGVFLFLSPLLLLGWGFALVIRAIRARLRHQPVGRGTAAYLIACVAVAGVLLTPYGVWQTIFVSRIADGPYAAEFLAEAAAMGDVRTVRALLRHGVSPAITTPDGHTALHGAAVGNQVEALALLVDAGTPLDALSRSGDSALEDAESSHSWDAARFLRARGAHRIRGSEAQHDRAVTEELARTMDAARERAKARGAAVPSP